MRSHRSPVVPFAPLIALVLLAGCGGRERAVVAPSPPPAPAVAPLPDGASPGMPVPEPLADGSFPTPNQGLSAAARVWHLRAGLSVAALSCPGEEGAAIRAGYDGLLVRQQAALALVAKSYAGEYRGGGNFDAAMTALHDFWTQTPARPGFCAAAAAVVTDLADADAAALVALAPAELAALDRPFIDFYRAYDAWRRTAPPRPVIAAAAVPPAGPTPGPRAVAPRRAALVLDLSTLPAEPGR